MKKQITIIALLTLASGCSLLDGMGILAKPASENPIVGLDIPTALDGKTFVGSGDAYRFTNGYISYRNDSGFGSAYKIIAEDTGTASESKLFISEGASLIGALYVKAGANNLFQVGHISSGVDTNSFPTIGNSSSPDQDYIRTNWMVDSAHEVSATAIPSTLQGTYVDSSNPNPVRYIITGNKLIESHTFSGNTSNQTNIILRITGTEPYYLYLSSSVYELSSSGLKQGWPSSYSPENNVSASDFTSSTLYPKE